MLDTQEIRCVVGNDHEALRKGLVDVLDAEDDLRVIGQACDGRELLELAELRRPDVTIVDLAMPTIDGIECCRRLTARPGAPAVILYTGNAEPETLETALGAGASGFVAESGAPQDLVRAVRAVHAGHPYVGAMLRAAVGRREAAASPLSDRESQVLQRLANGLTTAGVGNDLFLSPATVRSYAENAIRKLGADNRVHAVAIALRLGLIR